MASTADEGTNESERLTRIRHELRTLLSAVIGYAELALEDAGERGLEVFFPRLHEIHRAGRLLLNHVRELVRPDAFAAGARWEDLSDRAREPLATLLGRTAELLAEAAERAPGLVADLEKLFAASRDVEARVRRLAGDDAPVPAPAAAAARAPEALPAGTANGSVLVVDDDAINRDLITRHLVRAGYRVVLADSGRAALEELAIGDYDLVLLDVMMPGMDGFEVLRRIRCAGSRRPPLVILISAYDDMGHAVRGIELGAEDYLPRPFDPVLLKERVAAAIAKKRRRDEDEDVDDSELGRSFRAMTAVIRRREEDVRRRLTELTRGRGSTAGCR